MPKQGSALIAQMNALHVPAGSVALWWLGQMGVAVKGPDQQIIYIDPCLTDIINLKWPDPTRGPTRAIETPLQPDEVTNASLVLCSHEHIDHTDCFTLAGIAKASPRARVVATGWAQGELDEAGIAPERRIIPTVGRAIDAGVLKINAIPAAHYTREYDATKGERWLSLHLDWGSVTFFHGGDTILFDGYVESIKALPQIDFGVLASNGRDAMRDANDIVGNLYPSESAWLANELGWQTLIIGHNDLFAGNRLPAGEIYSQIERVAPQLAAHMLKPGELFLFSR